MTCLAYLNPLNAELNPICRLLALLGAHHILHVSRIRVNIYWGHSSKNSLGFQTHYLIDISGLCKSFAQ